MSTVKTNAILDASGGNTATINSMTPTADSLQGFRNRIINGDMRIDQRNAGASVTNSSSGVPTYILDRWGTVASQASKFTIQQDAGAVTPPAGFTDYLGVTSSSAYSRLSTDYFGIVQPIEGFNVADLNWGSANAKTITLSFWVRSSLTGTFAGRLTNSASNRSYVFTYTISSASTWEQKSVTIAGDTSGTWLTTNGVGIPLWFDLGTGSNFQTTAGSWQAGNFAATSSSTSVVGTNGATWYITGVQLEVGSVATPFERRPYGTEILLCQRYFQRAGQYATYAGRTSSTTQVRMGIPLNTYLRASPTLSNSGDGIAYSGGARVTASGGSVTADTFTNSTNMAAIVSGFTGLTDDRIYNINFSTADLFISAEL